MTNTEYYTRFISIWERSNSRQEAFKTIQERLDPEITYKQVMHKVDYARRKGVPLKKLDRDVVDWSTLRTRFGSIKKEQ
tara:strand:+ start:771 stop:1007 length:237 start_codon:yes stop_codon:yes gene_type:complete